LAELTLAIPIKRRRRLDDERGLLEQFEKRKISFEEAVNNRYKATEVMREGPERAQELLLFYGKEAVFFEDAASKCQTFSEDAADILVFIRGQVEQWNKFLKAHAASSCSGSHERTSLSHPFCSCKFPEVSVGKSALFNAMAKFILFSTEGSGSCQPRSKRQELLGKILLQIIGWEDMGGFSRAVSDHILKSMRSICDLLVSFAVENSGGQMSTELQELSQGIPENIDTLHKILDVGSPFDVYPTCLTCRAIHSCPPTGSDAKNGSIRRFSHPNICGADPLSGIAGKPCNQRLTAESVGQFCHQPMEKFLARFLSLPLLEDVAERFFTKARDPGHMINAYDGAFIPDLMKVLDKVSLPKSLQPLRLFFSMSFDFFNPLGNKQAGKHCSVGVIQLACLNLPPDERYKPTNLYLAAVIPGPKEVDVEQIHPYLRFVIEDLLKLSKGMFFTTTAKHPEGRLVQAFLGPICCDLPAARKLCGFKSHASHQLCHKCKLEGDKTGLNAGPNSDVDLEARLKERRKLTLVHEERDCDALRRHAFDHLNATTRKEKDAISREFGVRWSELNRLADDMLALYNPNRQIVVDPMHNLHLGLNQHHIRRLWCLEDDMVQRLSAPLGDEWRSKQASVLEELQRSLMRTLSVDNSAFAKADKPLLLQIAKANDIIVSEELKKEELLRAIRDWVSRIQRRKMGNLTNISASPGKLRGLDIDATSNS
jgi:hypothetical protein